MLVYRAAAFISIPYGSIKRCYCRAQRQHRSLISIPYGSIKRIAEQKFKEI